MDKIIDYFTESERFDARVTDVVDHPEEGYQFCCSEMESLCLEIDLYFMSANDPAEWDEMRKSKEYDALCRKRNSHLCAESNEKQDNLHETMDVNGEVSLTTFKITPVKEITGKDLHPITLELLEASKKNPQLHEAFKKAVELA